MTRNALDQAQSVINVIEEQRNSALNQLAQKQVLMDNKDARIAELEEQVAELKKPKKRVRRKAIK